MVTTSSTGLYGNFGQTNYGAAKLALVGFMNTLKLEGQKNNVHVNAISPGGRDADDREHPAAADRRAAEAGICDAGRGLSGAPRRRPTGAILTAGAGAFALARIYETEGVYLGEGGLSVEEVRDNWAKITDAAGQQAYVNGGEQTQKFFRQGDGRATALRAAPQVGRCAAASVRRCPGAARVRTACAASRNPLAPLGRASLMSERPREARLSVRFRGNPHACLRPLPPTPAPCPLPRLIAFALPGLPIGALAAALSVYLPRYYASHIGLSLAAVGLAFISVRLGDMCFDPFIGVLMDRTRTLLGRYRIWLLCGAPLLGIPVYMLFLAPIGVSLIYLVGWLFLYYLGTSVVALSHASWASVIAAQIP